MTSFREDTYRILVGSTIDYLDITNEFHYILGFQLVLVSCFFCEKSANLIELDERPVSKEWFIAACDFLMKKGWCPLPPENPGEWTVEIKCTECANQQQ